MRVELHSSGFTGTSRTARCMHALLYQPASEAHGQAKTASAATTYHTVIGVDVGDDLSHGQPR
ncbi:hypothetical protein NY94_23945 [Xanthomonas phaseoli pv. phaseoli]|nr:hypothetical protein NY94_23945 [Xanthomonas phaseoli pv. phaseoli]